MGWVKQHTFKMRYSPGFNCVIIVDSETDEIMFMPTKRFRNEIYAELDAEHELVMVDDFNDADWGVKIPIDPPHPSKQTE